MPNLDEALAGKANRCLVGASFISATRPHRVDRDGLMILTRLQRAC